MGFVTDGDLFERVRLEVEHRRVEESFQGQATAADLWRPAGDTGTVTLTSLPAAGYRWQARTVDESGRSSAWVAFGADSAAPDFQVVERASQMVFATQPPSSSAGVAMTPAIRLTARTPSGAVDTAFTGTVTVALADTDATLDGTRTRDAIRGAAVFDDLSITRAGAGYRLVASTDALPPVTSEPFAIAPAAAARVTFSTQPSDAGANEPIVPPVRVTAWDAFDNVATGFTGGVHVSLGRDPHLGLSRLSGTRSVTAVLGVAVFDDLRVDLAGSGFTLLAAAAGLPTIESTTFTVWLR
jgi:hypothetical protein